MSSLPWELPADAAAPENPLFLVDTRRCTGCHACSVACKVEFRVPLGEFRMRVRWLQHPETTQMGFLPVYSEANCDSCTHRQDVGLAPACVAACPTQALRFGDVGDPVMLMASEGSRELVDRKDTKVGVRYIGHEAWQEAKLNRGVALDPADDDITYEQR